jgi:superfamily II DNA/RNA helicase
VHVNTGELQLLVLDEADELLRNHSVAAVRELVAAVRKHGNRPGTLAVSATSSFGLQQFVGEHMRKGATVVDLTRGAMVTPATLSHFVVRLGRANAMFNAFTRLLAALRPACALSFHNSARSMEALEAHLRARGVPVGMLGNAYANAQRARALEGVREGRLRVLLSTEMAARGLDLPRVSHVINFDPPTSVREYVHRAGRAGRLSSLAPGRAGAVISFAGGDAEQDALVDICRELGVGLSQMSFEAGEAVVAGVGGGAAGVTQATQVTQELIAPVLGDEERARHERTLREERRVRGGRKGGVAGAGARAKDAELAARREIETMA